MLLSILYVINITLWEIYVFVLYTRILQIMHLQTYVSIKGITETVQFLQ